jgi:hypothetical protein
MPHLKGVARHNTVALSHLDSMLFQLAVVLPRIKVFPSKHGCYGLAHDAAEASQSDDVTRPRYFMTDQNDDAAFDGIKLATCLEKRLACLDAGQKPGEKPVAQVAPQIPKVWNQTARCGPMTSGDARWAGPNEIDPKQVVVGSIAVSNNLGTGRARRSARAVVGLAKGGAHGVTRPTPLPLENSCRTWNTGVASAITPYRENWQRGLDMKQQKKARRGL